MSKERSFNDYVAERTPRLTAELICVNCYHRYIGSWPEGTWLKDLTCPHCNTLGTIIATGQFLPDDL